MTLELADFDISSEITSDITSELFSFPEFCPVFLLFAAGVIRTPPPQLAEDDCEVTFTSSAHDASARLVCHAAVGDVCEAAHLRLRGMVTPEITERDNFILLCLITSSPVVLSLKTQTGSGFKQFTRRPRCGDVTAYGASCFRSLSALQTVSFVSS